MVKCPRTVRIELLLDEAHAMALAQFVKRSGWTEWRHNAIDDAEAYLMRDAMVDLDLALRAAGFAPR
jgi:hypothetical protein